MEKRVKTRFILILITGLSLLAYLSCSFCFKTDRNDHSDSNKEDQSANIPSLSEISKVNATAFNSLELRPDLPLFALSQEYYSDLLKWIKPSTPFKDKPPSLRYCIGKLSITTKDGKSIHINYYWMGKSPVVFTLDGIHFFQGSTSPFQDGGLALDHMIRNAFLASKKGK
jgi:hypothetical protein